MTDSEKLILDAQIGRARREAQNCKAVFLQAKERGDEQAIKDAYRYGWFWNGWAKALEELSYLID